MDWYEYMLDCEEQRRHTEDDPELDDALRAIEIALRNTDRAIAILAERVYPVVNVDEPF